MAPEQARRSNKREGEEGEGTSEITEVESGTENNNKDVRWTQIPLKLEWMGVKEMADGKFTAVVYDENTPSLLEKLVLNTFDTKEEAARAQEESLGKHLPAYDYALMTNQVWRMEEDGADERESGGETGKRVKKKGLVQKFKAGFKKMLHKKDNKKKD
ncbi:hypothetical protein AMTR_s00072p00108530 [Amborella trichopoda]|uniref:Uncharacterized protein n=1 Tax=Amborella trichopoda TaxID=13333 RepID=W1NTF5_AMBTC|nr:hypothetical protein AMTR_s00072p00108530 [Amborella trichopoda]